MAKKSIQKNQPFPFKGFLDVSLTQAQLAGQKSWQVSDEDLVSGLQRLTESGYGVKFRWDERNACHMATASPTNPEHDLAGWYLSGRGSTPMKALKQLLYIHYCMWDGVWPVGGLDNPKREDFE